MMLRTDEFIGTHTVIPIRMPFPIWRYGPLHNLFGEYVRDGWYPDWYRYHKTWRIFP